MGCYSQFVGAVEFSETVYVKSCLDQSGLGPGLTSLLD